jgi:hypothetical protein
VDVWRLASGLLSGRKWSIYFLLAVVALGALAYLLYQTTVGAETVVSGEKILLVGETEQSDGRFGSTIERLEDAGFQVTTDDAVIQSLSDRNVAAFLVTRSQYGKVPAEAWQRLYSTHVLVGGLDVSVPELDKTIFDRQAGSSWLPYTPERPVFAFMYLAKDCSLGVMSDWLDNWDNLAQVMESRMAQIANSVGDQDCKVYEEKLDEYR